MKYSLSLKALLSLTIPFFILACSGYGYLTPEETLQSYVNLLMEGRIGEASELRYSPLREWANFKEVLGAVLVLSLITVVIRLTGLNPFSTMLSCYLIENHVSRENRKYVLAAIGIFFVLTAVGFYSFLTGFLTRLTVETDLLVLDNPARVEVLDSRISGNIAYVSYVLIYPNGEEVEREAELHFQKGLWRVKRL
jgi:hypothetical protein